MFVSHEFDVHKMKKKFSTFEFVFENVFPSPRYCFYLSIFISYVTYFEAGKQIDIDVSASHVMIDYVGTRLRMISNH